MATVASAPSPLTAITTDDLPLDILPTRNNSTHHRESTVHRESIDSACIDPPTRPDSASITIADPVANPYIHDFKDKDGNPIDDQVAVPVIVLPDYEKPDEEFDHDDHSWCCALAPTYLHPSAVQEQGIKPLWTDNPSLAPNRLGLVATAWTSEGDRKYMEDRHRIVYGGSVDVSEIPDLRVFGGVFDGHGGDEAAHVTAHVLFEKFVAVYKTDPLADMKSILLRTYAEMETHIIRESLNVGWVSGTTAVSVFVIGDKIYCVNTGDSRAVLCRGTTAVGLSVDHRPSAESEKLRVLAANGIVKQAVRRRRRCGCFGPPFVEEGSVRVWPGGFSVSRTLGDVQYKVPELGFIAPEHVGVLIADADITVTDISPMDRFIILASDGFWDVMNNEQAVEFGRKYIDKYDPQYVAEKLVAKAYSLGSDDNITVVAIFFTHHPKEGSRWHMVSSNSNIRQQQQQQQAEAQVAPAGQSIIAGPEISPSSSTNCSTSTSAVPSAAEPAGNAQAEPTSMAEPASIVDHS